MATKKVNIDIVAKDKSKRALNTVRGSLDKLKSSVFNVRNALAGLGAGLVIRNLVNTGKELENLEVRFKFLLKNAEEGAKAFENMTKFASQVPFSLEEIQAGSGILATVTDNADDLQKMLEITGNVAATTGLDFRTAAEQIQRSFSAGIGAADLFREKGVRNMLGFKAGATVSIEDTVKAFDRVFGKGGEFGQATDELANTFEGTLSMIGDKFFNFKREILKAGFFPELKKQFKDLDTFLGDNTKGLDEFAKKIGQTLARAVKGTANAFKFIKDNADTFFEVLSGIIALKVASVFFNMAMQLKGLTIAMTGFNLATKKNIIFASVGLFVTTFGLLINKFKDFKKELSDGTFETENSRKSISQLKFEINKLDEAIQFRLNTGLKNFKTLLSGPEVPESGKSIEQLQEEIKSLSLQLKLASENQNKFKEKTKETNFVLHELDEQIGLSLEQIKKFVKAFRLEEAQKAANVYKILNQQFDEAEEIIGLTNEQIKELNRNIAETKNVENLEKIVAVFKTLQQREKTDEGIIGLTNAQLKEIKENLNLRELEQMANVFKALNNERLDDEGIIGLTNEENEAIKEQIKLKNNMFEGFKTGFKSFTNDSITAFDRFKKAGEDSARAVKNALTDFVMTGKLNISDLGRTIVRTLVDALIGSAVKSAMAKSESMMLMSTIRKALRSVYEGALKTFSSIPFPFNIAATGLAIKFGMGLVNKIKGFEKGGIARANQPAIVGEAGPELIMPRKDMQVTPNNKLGTMGGSVNVNFTINAVDTRGFRSLLTNERGTIVNIINQAVTDKGRPVLV
jgi:hypothetical protein